MKSALKNICENIQSYDRTGLPDISWEEKLNHVWKKSKLGKKKPNCKFTQNLKFFISW